MTSSSWALPPIAQVSALRVLGCARYIFRENKGANQHTRQSGGLGGGGCSGVFRFARRGTHRRVDTKWMQRRHFGSSSSVSVQCGYCMQSMTQPKELESRVESSRPWCDWVNIPSKETFGSEPWCISLRSSHAFPQVLYVDFSPFIHFFFFFLFHCTRKETMTTTTTTAAGASNSQTRYYIDINDNVWRIARGRRTSGTRSKERVQQEIVIFFFLRLPRTYCY